MAQDILFCYRAIEGEYKEQLPKVRQLLEATFREPQYKIKPFLVNPNNMKELVRQQDLSFFNPPMAIFYNTVDCGRLDEARNYGPLIEKCKSLAILHVIDSNPHLADALCLHWHGAYREWFQNYTHTVINLDKNNLTFSSEQLAKLKVTNDVSPQRSVCRIT